MGITPAQCAKLFLLAGLSHETAARSGARERQSATQTAAQRKKAAPVAKSPSKPVVAASRAQRASSKKVPAVSKKAPGGGGGTDGVKAYHAWVAAHRRKHGVDLADARAAYNKLSEADKLAWRENWSRGY